MLGGAVESVGIERPKLRRRHVRSLVELALNVESHLLSNCDCNRWRVRANGILKTQSKSNCTIQVRFQTSAGHHSLDPTGGNRIKRGLGSSRSGYSRFESVTKSR